MASLKDTVSLFFGFHIRQSPRLARALSLVLNIPQNDLMVSQDRYIVIYIDSFLCEVILICSERFTFYRATKPKFLNVETGVVEEFDGSAYRTGLYIAFYCLFVIIEVNTHGILKDELIFILI